MARVLFQIEVRDSAGDPIDGASIALTQRVGGAAVTHWSAETGGTSATTAITTDANGRSTQRWVDSGSYSAAITKAGYDASSRAIDLVRGDAVELIADDSVDTSQFADLAVTAAKLTNNAATLNKFATNAVTEPKLADDAVSSRTVPVGAVTNAKIADNAITSAKILDRSVLAEHISAGSVGGGTVGTNELADGGVDEAALNTDAVLTTHFMNWVVTEDKLEPNAIYDEHLAEGTLDAGHIANEVLPVGMVIAYGGAAAPSEEWMLPQGQAISRSTYSVLFGIIGTTYGVGDGSTTFNLPDYRGCTPVGVGTEASVNALGDSDTALGTSLGNRGPYHGHTTGSVVITGGGDHLHYYYLAVDGGGALAAGDCCDHVYDGNVGSGTHNTGEHSHTVSGIAGDLADPNWVDSANALHHQVVNHLIKVL